MIFNKLCKHFIIFICLSFSSLSLFSQNISTTKSTVGGTPTFILLKNEMLLHRKTDVPTKVYLERQKLPFFCDLEVKLESSAKMPVKFRLGEVHLVDKLEGKH